MGHEGHEGPDGKDRPPQWYWDNRSNAMGLDMGDWHRGWRMNDQESPDGMIEDTFKKADWNGDGILDEKEFFTVA